MSIRIRPALTVGALAALSLAASHASAAVVVAGGGLALVQQGGSFDAGNLAAGKYAFAPNIEGQDPSFPNPDQPTGYGGAHNTAGVTNGTYGNGNGTWLAGAANSYLGLNLGGSVSIQSIAYGRDNLGVYPDRSNGLVTLEYTTDSSPSLATSSWSTIGTMNYSGEPSDAVRHRFDFSPVTATGVRLIMGTSGRGIDELELYNAHYVLPALTVGTPLVQDEVTNATGLPNQGAPIPNEPSPGQGQYHYTTGPGSFTWSAGVTGTNVKVETSWGVSNNHTRDADYFFDPDGAGPLPEVPLTQNLRQDEANDQGTPIAAGSVVWSDYYTIGTGLTLTADSVFRVTGTNVGGIAPEALTSSVWRFTAVPEPGSLAGVAFLALAWLRRIRRR